MRRIRDEVILVQVPVMNPDGLDKVVAWYTQEPRHALRGGADGRAVPPLRRPRQQPRLVHVQHAGVAQRGEAALRGVVPPDRLQPPPVGALPRPHLRAALRRSHEPEHPAPGDARRRHGGRCDHARGSRRKARSARSAASASTPGGTGGCAPRPTSTTWSASSPRPPSGATRRPTSTTPRSCPSASATACPPTCRRRSTRAPGGAAGGGCGTPWTTSSPPRWRRSTSAPASATDWLYGMYLMGRDAIAAGTKGEPYAYVIPAGRRSGTPPPPPGWWTCCARAAVEVQRASAEFKAGDKTFPRGSFVVPMAQPFRAYAKDLLETQRYPGATGGHRAARRFVPTTSPGGRLPAQMGVEGSWVAKPFEAPLETLAGPPPRPPPSAAPETSTSPPRAPTTPSFSPTGPGRRGRGAARHRRLQRGGARLPRRHVPP